MSDPLPRSSHAETAAEFAAIHGVLQRDAQGALTHCPLMLTPAPILPSTLAQLEQLTAPFCLLSHRVALDLDFLEQTLRPAAATDDYTRFLLDLAVEHGRGDQDWRLSVVRSDYFETPAGDGLRQVELNTIAASYVGLASRISRFHETWRRVSAADWELIPNDPASAVADAMAEAVAEYGAARGCVLEIVQAAERNVFDQRILEAALAERGVAVIRCELEALLERASLRDGDLRVDGRIAALTYFRAGYRPDELYSEGAREARRLLARSSSICVPDLATHLSGTKKVQQVLTRPEQLARFLDEADAAAVGRAFAMIAGLDDPVVVDGRELSGVEAALARPQEFVLKPQREGGGFNIYGEQIVELLTNMSAEERDAYVLMERLHPPERQALGMRGGELWEDLVVSEIGHFGALLARGDELRFNRGAGYLVRTKSRDQDEGGISAGAGHLDSLIRRSS